MHIGELDFPYPENLIATERAETSRVMVVDASGKLTENLRRPYELESMANLVELFRPGDLLVINDTKVLKRRVFSASGLEILFLAPLEANDPNDFGKIWSVLCPSSRWKNGTLQVLPQSAAQRPEQTANQKNITLEILERGRPQTVRASQALTEAYFEEVGELPLPPYIQQARGERHNREFDQAQYQTAWAEKNGSLAAPTASLHFTEQSLNRLREKGVEIARVTLHVGLGTFLPVTAERLDDHIMHAEIAEISRETNLAVERALGRGARIWALGTTVTRTLESAAMGKFGEKKSDGAYRGETDLFIRPGYEYRIVSGLLTNFHQPRSTLLALVGAFAGLDTLKSAYAWAIEKEFRLFSYGDLSVWIK
jgi:S-adenosylmethionine:tRNA ribosyltransferase-isomerase